MDGIAFVRNQGGVIHAVPEADLADHLARPGMAPATLEDWLAQEGTTLENTDAEPVQQPVQKPAKATKSKGGK